MQRMIYLHVYFQGIIYLPGKDSGGRKKESQATIFTTIYH